MEQPKRRGRPKKECEFMLALKEGLMQENEDEELLDIYPLDNDGNPVVDDFGKTYETHMEYLKSLEPPPLHQSEIQRIKEQEEALKEHKKKVLEQGREINEYQTKEAETPVYGFTMDCPKKIVKFIKSGRPQSIKYKTLLPETQALVMALLASPDNEDGRITRALRLVFYDDEDEDSLFFSKRKVRLNPNFVPKHNEKKPKPDDGTNPTKRKAGRPRKETTTTVSSTPIRSFSSESPPISASSSSSPRIIKKRGPGRPPLPTRKTAMRQWEVNKVLGRPPGSGSTRLGAPPAKRSHV